MNELMKFWDLIDNYRSLNNIILVSQNKVNANYVLYSTVCNQLTKYYIRKTFNIR